MAGPAFTEILREHAYRRLWISGFCINAARWMSLVVLGWIALPLSGSPVRVGMACFVRSAPMIILGPFACVVADRIHRGRVLLFTQSLGVATALALFLLFATGHGGYWPLVGLEMLFGVLWALDFPARRTALFSLVGAGRVATAISLGRCPCSSGRWRARCSRAWDWQAGPGACRRHGYSLRAGLAVSVGLGSRIGRVAHGSALMRAVSARASGRRGRAHGARRAVITVLMNAPLPYQHMLAVFARRAGAGPEWLGALVAADGPGLLGALPSPASWPLPTAASSYAVPVAPLLLIVFTGARWRWVCVVRLVMIGMAESGFATMQSTLVLLAAPEERRGGAMGILSACIGTQPLGTLWVGFLATGIGVAPAIALNSLLASGHYNWHRPHTAVGGQPPITRVISSADNLVRLHS
jgi:hypothetical protein